MTEEKSWLEVEMEETMALLRKKLERMNDKSVDELTTTDIHCLKGMWKTIYYIKSVKAAMK